MSDVPNDDSNENPSISEPVKVVKFAEEWWLARNNAGRCTAHRRNGNRCQKPAMEGQRVCGTHGGRAPHAKRAARRRLEEASQMLAKELLKMATDDDVSDAVKLNAIKDALDRGGLKAPTQVELEVGPPRPYEQILAGIAPMTRAESRARRGLTDSTPALPGGVSRNAPAPDGEIVDAEIVPDPHVERPDGAAEAPAWAEPGNVRPRRAQPGTGLMTLAEANEELARAERDYNMQNDQRR
ncbi:hypothetical protein AFM11_23300 [Mycolicibacterium wolinskyi]|uniref:Uncharacterized protein n=1 Tax=Mycolicibacterium wolinskyi TaxID=59750 RepID=A0A132PHK3_9MYCO|nr:hypothetical protein [Mycolicibacterium wolinskyi]KWX21783.1 hypothetical protein AFM11_23300 [Mycolicibacterium wolinskyi]